MQKISTAQVKGLLTDAAVSLRKIAAERDHYKKVAEAYETQDRVTKLAHAMKEKGMDDGMSVDELVDHLYKVAAAGELDLTERAVEISGPNMTERMGKLGSRSGATSLPSDFSTTDSATQSPARDRFESWLMSGD